MTREELCRTEQGREVHCITVEISAVLYHEVQCNAVQCSAVDILYTAVQHSVTFE